VVAAVITHLQINITEHTVVIETPIYEHSFLIRSVDIIFHVCSVYQILLLAGNIATEETFSI
jgi:hypothetical protein